MEKKFRVFGGRIQRTRVLGAILAHVETIDQAKNDERSQVPQDLRDTDSTDLLQIETHEKMHPWV